MTRTTVPTAVQQSPTTRRRSTRTVVLMAGSVAALTFGTLPAAAAPGPATPASVAPAGHHRAPVLDRIELPAGFQPEGIATGPRNQAYFGSRVDGDIYRADLRTGRGSVISQGPGTPSLGMKVDARGRLFVAGGAGGDARVIDTRTGKVLASYRLVTGTAFINDVVLTRDAAYFTDSANAQLFALPLGRGGSLPKAGQVRRIALGGAWQQVTGNNGNGITTTPDGRALLVVNSSSGLLYRVDPRTGVATVVDLGGTLLTNGDGLLREGRTLYTVQNRLNSIAVVRLAKDGRSGTLTSAITSPDFDVPTTIARSGNSFFLPNARFTTTPTPTTEYWVTRIAAPRC